MITNNIRLKMPFMLKYLWLVFAMLVGVQASPHALLPRFSKIIDCGDKEAKVQTALADAAALAKIAINMDTSSTAYVLQNSLYWN